MLKSQQKHTFENSSTPETEEILSSARCEKAEPLWTWGGDPLRWRVEQGCTVSQEGKGTNNAGN